MWLKISCYRRSMDANLTAEVEDFISCKHRDMCTYTLKGPRLVNKVTSHHYLKGGALFLGPTNLHLSATSCQVKFKRRQLARVCMWLVKRLYICYFEAWVYSFNHLSVYSVWSKLPSTHTSNYSNESTFTVAPTAPETNILASSTVLKTFPCTESREIYQYLAHEVIWCTLARVKGIKLVIVEPV